MAGIGVRLNRMFSKETILSSLLGFGYSMMITVTPMIVVIGNVLLMGKVLGYDRIGYAARNLFSAIILYIFMFSLIVTSPFNSVLSRYLSDVIYEENYDDILPCYYLGLALNIGLASLVGIPFCIRWYLVSDTELFFVCLGYCGYIAMVFVFYSMLFLSICKDYGKIAAYFFFGMALAFIVSLFLVFVFRMEIAKGMLLALIIGFLFTAVLENATIRRYFKYNSNRYKKVLGHFKKYWRLVFSNLLYTAGLFAHNFIFWTSHLRMVVADTFVMAPSYDMASCVAMFTNISATVIFTARVEMHFHERYKTYSEAVTGGRWQDIVNTKNRMFRQLSSELMTLVRIQFIISVIVYLVISVFLPRFGFAGMPLLIYPCLAAGYFILFVMYSEIVFLYYFNDMNGALLTVVSFCIVTVFGSLYAMNLSEIWYGIGLVAGSAVGFSVAYHRIRWVERHLDEHIFCKGDLFPIKREKKPTSKVFSR